MSFLHILVLLFFGLMVSLSNIKVLPHFTNVNDVSILKNETSNLNQKDVYMKDKIASIPDQDNLINFNSPVNNVSPMFKQSSDVYAAHVMGMIATLESSVLWNHLRENPYLLHSDYKQYEYMKKLEHKNKSEFLRILRYTARGHFGMTASALWDAMSYKEQLVYVEEEKEWLVKVQDILKELHPNLGSVPMMSLELAILYLRHGAANMDVINLTTSLNKQDLDALKAMKASGDYRYIWAFLWAHPKFTYSIWNRGLNPDKSAYVLADHQITNIEKYMVFSKGELDD